MKPTATPVRLVRLAVRFWVLGPSKVLGYLTMVPGYS